MSRDLRLAAPARRRFPIAPAFSAALSALLLALPSALAAEPATWRIDPTHTRVVFDVDHAGFSRSLATVSGITGTLRFDPDGWDGAAVEAELPMHRVDFGDDDWNRAMAGRRWFHVEAHPVARFRSVSITPIDAETARLDGELTIRGRTVPVVLDLRRNAVKRHPLTLRRMAGFSATAELDRRDFGITGAPNMIGHAVRVRVELEAVRDARRGADDPPSADASSADTPPADAAPTPPEPDHADPQHR